MSLISGKGMEYMPAAASHAAAHKGRIKNIRLNTLRDSQQTSDYRSCILSFEKEACQHDNSMKKKLEGMKL